MTFSRRPPNRSFGKRWPLAFFAAAVVVPGLVLSALGVQMLRQDRQQASRQIVERLELETDRALANLDRELRSWDAALAEVRTGSAPPVEPLPGLLLTVMRSEADGVLVLIEPDRVVTVPPRRLLHQVGERARAWLTDGRLPDALETAERLELQQRDLPAALAAYRRLSGVASDERVTAEALVRLARTLRKMGRETEGREAYHALERLGHVSVGGVPADLVARFELCAPGAVSPTAGAADACTFEFFRDLVDGRWTIDRTWYATYADRARERLQRLGPAPAALARLLERESSKRVLTDLVEVEIREWSPPVAFSPSGHQIASCPAGAALAFWRSTGSAGYLAGLVLSPAFVTASVWHKAFERAIALDRDLALVAPDGRIVFASSPPVPAGTSRTLEVTRTFQDGDLLWRLRLWPRHPELLFKEVTQRLWLYVAMLAVMAVSLVLGSVLTMRTVAKELDIARLKSQFVSAVSHEFRTPLTGIRQFSEMLLHDRVLAEDRKHHYYAMILHATERLSHLVENLLDFARMEEGRQEYRFEPIDTSAWLREAAAGLADVQDTKSIVTAIPDGLPPITGDRQALERAIDNLLDNAVKYSPACDTIWLEADAQAGFLIVRVRDHGVGIPVDERAHIFERFFRGHQMANAVKGAGLGLSLVRHIVTAHRGTLDVESAVGEGSTFMLRLPLLQQTATVEADARRS
jgi:signal transduction histidine kinase